MTTEKVNVFEIFTKYGIDVKAIEPSVYKVLNTDNEVSIDELQWDLESCIIIASYKTRYKRLPFGGINSTMAYVYYIITDFDKYELGHKYIRIAKQQYGQAYYMDYKYRPGIADSIDTIYAEGELF